MTVTGDRPTHPLSFTSPAGPITLYATSQGISRLTFTREITCAVTKCSLLTLARNQLQQYFSGVLRKFSIPLDIKGSAFDLQVWSIIQDLDYGQIISYQEIASKLGNHRACRAAGNAVGRNPVPIFIACHRIVRKDGSIGGFSSPLEIKRFLLDLEQSTAMSR